MHDAGRQQNGLRVAGNEHATKHRSCRLGNLAMPYIHEVEPSRKKIVEEDYR